MMVNKELREIKCWMPMTPPGKPLFAEISSITSDGMYMDKIDIDELSCTEILGLAEDISAIQQHQFRTQVDVPRIDKFELNLGLEKVNEEVPANPSKNKKQKVGVDLNKKPGEKRQNKYYWPKIDVQKVAATPKPKTPKPATPKAVRKKAVKKKVEHAPNCKRALNFEEEKVNIIENQQVDVVKQVESLRVYRRRFGWKCVNQCQKLGPNLGASCKKKRSMRIKKDFEEYEGFIYGLISKDLVDPICIVKGKKIILLPKKMKIVEQGCFDCILSILCSMVKITKKKRSPKRVRSAINVNKHGISSDNSPPPVPKPILKDEHEIVHISSEQCETGSGQLNERLASSSRCSTSDSTLKRETKVKVEKQMTPKRTYKRKDKRTDYLSNVDDWHDKSLEQIMDAFIQEFEALKLYDDPKKLERWSVMLSGAYNGAHVPDEEKARFREETAILHTRIFRFLTEMTKFQGRKEFVKWNGSVLDSVVGVFLTQNVSDVLSSNAYMALASRYPIKPRSNGDEGDAELISSSSSQESLASNVIIEHPNEEETTPVEEKTTPVEEETTLVQEKTTRVEEGETTTRVEEGGESSKEYEGALNDMLGALPYLQGYSGKDKKVGNVVKKVVDWEAIRLHFLRHNNTQKNPDRQDSVDWEAVRKAPVAHIAEAINSRGQHRIIAAKIQRTLNRLFHQHGTLDVEWLREAPPQVAKAYLLSFYGLGLKSVECLRLLTLHHHGFPVDVNIGRIAIRLGWVPLKPLPLGLPFHLLQKYPIENEIQQYIWPRLCHLKQESLYQIHYQMITFGKVFCLKKNPNCRACPFKQECKYYKSLVESTKLKQPLLSWTKDKKMVIGKRNSKKNKNIPNPFDIKKDSPKPHLLLVGSSYDTSLSLLDCNANSHLWQTNHVFPSECQPDPIIEFPPSPKKVEETDLPDIEDLFKDDVNEAEEEFIVIKLETQVNKQTFPTSFEENKVALHKDGLSRALVSLLPEDSIPLPKQINPARLRTEHQVYELPYNHPLLKDLDRQQGNIPYLLAIWTQGGNEKIGDTLEGCSENSLTVPGTILVPVRTAMRGSFPLNGTYFQVNEVFADYESSERPINVPTSWIWMLEKRTLYCGSGTSSIFRGLTEDEIQHCCWEGYICTRGFNQRTRAPKALPLRFHNRPIVKGKLQQDEDEED